MVILPAFGVTAAMLEQFDRRAVWRRHHRGRSSTSECRLREGGYTSIIHGAVWHEKPDGAAGGARKYLVVRSP
jgi:hypothetical protein